MMERIFFENMRYRKWREYFFGKKEVKTMMERIYFLEKGGIENDGEYFF